MDASGTLNAGDTDIIENAWDHRNRLVSVTNYDTFADYGVTSSQEVDYVYDYLNRLVARTLDADTEYFIYDGGSEDVRWTLTDHQNTVRDLVAYDAAQDEASVINHITYDTYGNILSESDTVDHLFAYTGRLFDESTALQNNLNRWYDPRVSCHFTIIPKQCHVGLG